METLAHSPIWLIDLICSAEDNLPIAPAPLPQLLESLWLVVRRAGYTYLNQAPVAAPTVSGQNLVTGVITGKLNATDYDDDHLTYSVSGNPAHGSVTVDAAGNFVYTPTAALAVAGGQDEFTVTIDDRPGNPQRIHGPLDLSGLVNKTTVTVKVTVVPIKDALTTFDLPPEAISSGGVVIASNGVVYQGLGSITESLSNGTVKQTTVVRVIDPISATSTVHTLQGTGVGEFIIASDGTAYLATTKALYAINAAVVTSSML